MIKTAIIGCGNIGSKYDENTLSSKYASSHASAILSNPQLSLVAMADKDENRLQTACKARKVNSGYKNPVQLIESEKIDLLVLAIPPGKERKQLLIKALKSGIKNIICEKPFALSLLEVQEMIKLARHYKACVTVNYLRRWNKKIQDIKKSLDEDKDPIENVLIHLSGGIWTNGSHALDLVNYLLKAKSSKVLYSKKFSSQKSPDLNSKDYQISCGLEWKGFQTKKYAHLQFNSVDEKKISLFELDLFTREKRIKILDYGNKIEISHKVQDPLFPDFFTFREMEKMEHCADGIFENMYAEVIEHFNQPKRLISGIEESLVLTRTIENCIRNS